MLAVKIILTNWVTRFITTQYIAWIFCNHNVQTENQSEDIVYPSKYKQAYKKMNYLCTF